ncbi:bromodomain and WD repeat-containing protein 1-like isoform X2 [Zingiber officinale]|uniref:bromodomain and WD repeat-containing protein 1-like isoform X1 n=1 Tax=Zingiber officinale TaxID=94328 RepID=UPI001C4DA7F6|nr:bromodomain and WD repeat-containing protein 1-like isoform X1 [Zingiber officinale]XP_042432592.1 bromodomain and WD repeat-containing protein 1-like isoform X2 [Zingiber officinale]XP_042432597.1 bromodomain and WD repeat-containing protein 1-like isoform X2 [Zingiber officinale]
MAPSKCKPPGDETPTTVAPLKFSRRMFEKLNSVDQRMTPEIDIREVYLLIMHFLSSGPCKRTYEQLQNELLEHKLLPRRYHAWYSRSGAPSGDEDDDGLSLPLCYIKLTQRYPHIEKDHILKLLKQLLVNSSPLPAMIGGVSNAAVFPTLTGSGSFSLLASDRDKEIKSSNKLPRYLRWPHMHAGQVHGLNLREIGGGFTKHCRAPSIRAACYAIAKPSTLVQKMEIIKKLRGHQNAVYCATFDRSGRYVITGSDDRLVKIWSMETAFCLASCRGHEGDITDLAVSSNNAVVASSANDFIIRVWHLPDGHPISVLKGHTGAVTAIAFNPRPAAVYQLLSSSDDGTCRIWDARQSNANPRIYIPKPLDTLAGKVTDPSPSAGQQTHQILCCAFNANGTVFVTGSSDTYARVWNAYKSNLDDPEQSNQEMDLLCGHENDVNYVQFSGCAVGSRSSLGDTLKEDNLPKFKNSWFTQDNLVTCSRDGSAIIWIPRSRRSHGKVGRWTRAYHLRVPMPPMPPQPRGGPRLRCQPTPRGVNMIVWSLDNRYVLAAIMDCRICVWNASDGSLLHSLIGHEESTFVLDVHPFDPRIAMSAGYDGKLIIWDIWEGMPVRIYETGRFKLVDGKFSPDGISVILSDEVGQIFIIATGQGDSQKDAKYDQFFLGDYRPLMQDTSGNVLDQETQLPPHRRNIQDLLCDSGMIPYPEPYQSMYQRRRLGILGIEWRPGSLKLAVGPTYNASIGDFQALPIVDLEQWVEPLPEIVEAIDWEIENDVQSDDADSEYNLTDEYSSQAGQESLSSSSCGEAESSAGNSEGDNDGKVGVKRSKRKKHSYETELTTSSGRRVKRRNFDECNGASMSRSHRTRRSMNGRLKRLKASKSEPSRPQRIAKKNALTFFSKLTSVSTDEDHEPDSNFSESESMFPDSKTQSFESERSLKFNLLSGVKESIKDEYEAAAIPSEVINKQDSPVSKRRLVLKLPCHVVSGTVISEWPKQDNLSISLPTSNSVVNSHRIPESEIAETVSSQNEIPSHRHFLVDHQTSMIKWGEVKQRSSKRPRVGDMVTWAAANTSVDDPNTAGDDTIGIISGDECRTSISWKQTNEKSNDRYAAGNKGVDATPHLLSLESMSLVQQSSISIQESEQVVLPHKCVDIRNESVEAENLNPVNHECKVLNESSEVYELVPNKTVNYFGSKCSFDVDPQVDETMKTTHPNMWFKTRGSVQEFNSSSLKLKSSVLNSLRSAEDDLVSDSPTPSDQDLDLAADEDEGTNRKSLEPGKSNNISENSEGWTTTNASLSVSHDCLDLKSYPKMYDAVYKRTKPSKGKESCITDVQVKQETTSDSVDHDEATLLLSGKIRNSNRKKPTGGRAPNHDLSCSMNNFDNNFFSSLGASTSRGKSASSSCNQFLVDDWKSTSKMPVGLRSVRNRRENYNTTDFRCMDKKSHQSLRKLSWLLLLEHEECYRYIPQKGDEVAYLIQGHREYIESTATTEVGPWKSIKGLKAVEFCKVQELEYSTLPGSGDSCCKLTLEFKDPSSCGFKKTFRVTLPELNDPDFLVERLRYDASIERNWTHRDKCQVWWKDADGSGGSWWSGRILAVKPKDSQFPDSPWEKYVVQYKDDSSGQHLHSPWELHDVNTHWEHPSISNETRNALLYYISKIEQASIRNQDYHGVQKMNQVAQKSNFLNRFPVPLSLEVIKRRLENNYYRTVDAVKHDSDVMISNAETHFIKSAEMKSKIKRLKESIKRTFSSLTDEKQTKESS